jgi:hypothetical protein
MKALGIVGVVLVLGAVFSGVYGSGWMGFGHHGMSGRGSGEYCGDADMECGREGSSHMMLYRNLDISEEDLVRIEMIISDAEEQISEILSQYGIEDLRGSHSSGGSCH